MDIPPIGTGTTMKRARALPIDPTDTDQIAPIADMIETEIIMSTRVKKHLRSPWFYRWRRDSSQDGIWRCSSPCSRCTWTFRKVYILKTYQRTRLKADGKVLSKNGIIQQFSTLNSPVANMGHRNRAELAEGWYDPATLQRARESIAEGQPPPDRERGSPDYARGGKVENVESRAPPVAQDEENDDDDDDEYGPTLPHPNSGRNLTHSGPTIPRLQDLELKRESAAEDAMADRQESWQQHRSDIRSHKSAVRNLEDEVAPRAEAGTRERQLEKRREAAAANREFANARGASPEAAPEEELMGSGDNDLASLKKEKEKDQRKKNEREIRREEILRARVAEREERVQKYREKEQETIGWLQTLAKQRFG
ncbi:hypothetical protein N7466_009001 [Penicillium verhagenii]|uniref:uncharacterized protein n=1 Tax=Penicillium verhagenii TaxID=1562060 RepID=UPI0025452878|nr:uncharacterized protein N7466_009001 [Penicillium verhagenii]KAJ5924814.1 hypothetical protein N7466_009001 [Penicillium verhagenii]